MFPFFSGSVLFLPVLCCVYWFSVVFTCSVLCFLALCCACLLCVVLTCCVLCLLVICCAYLFCVVFICSVSMLSILYCHSVVLTFIYEKSELSIIHYFLYDLFLQTKYVGNLKMIISFQKCFINRLK